MEKREAERKEIELASTEGGVDCSLSCALKALLGVVLRRGGFSCAGRSEALASGGWRQRVGVECLGSSPSAELAGWVETGGWE